MPCGKVSKRRWRFDPIHRTPWRGLSVDAAFDFATGRPGRRRTECASKGGNGSFAPDSRCAGYGGAICSTDTDLFGILVRN